MCCLFVYKIACRTRQLKGFIFGAGFRLIFDYKQLLEKDLGHTS